jgi:hypothetical protein
VDRLGPLPDGDTGRTIVGLVRVRARGWLSGLGAGVVAVVGLLAGTMLASMVITFFLHEI